MELIPVKYFSITYLELIPAKTIDFWLIPVKSWDTPPPPTPYWIVACRAFGAKFTGIESYGPTVGVQVVAPNEIK